MTANPQIAADTRLRGTMRDDLYEVLTIEARADF